MGEGGRSVPEPVARDTAEPDVLRALVENHGRFLAFVERRVGSREEAEDILQDAFVRGIDRAPTVRQPESAVAWFYRLLRNALIDHYRRHDAEARARARFAARGDGVEPALDQELMDTICGCVMGLLETLRPEYAAALRRVELDGLSVRAFAQEAGITPNNAAVRLHRARQALRRQLERCCGTCVTHGCLDCTCGGAAD